MHSESDSAARTEPATGTETSAGTEPAKVIEAVLATSELEYERPAEGAYFVKLPGQHKLATMAWLIIRDYSLHLEAFFCRKPDENHAEFYRFLLQKNGRMFGMAFALDPLGDIFLDARLPLTVVTPEELDRLLGSVLTYADESFNQILELGFATSIRKEWKWRVENGEPTANLEAFRGWLEAES
jgi:hypothetical protein